MILLEQVGEEDCQNLVGQAQQFVNRTFSKHHVPILASSQFLDENVHIIEESVHVINESGKIIDETGHILDENEQISGATVHLLDVSGNLIDKNEP